MSYFSLGTGLRDEESTELKHVARRISSGPSV